MMMQDKMGNGGLKLRDRHFAWLLDNKLEFLGVIYRPKAAPEPELVGRSVVGQKEDSVEALLFQEIFQQADKHPSASTALLIARDVDFLELDDPILVRGDDDVSGYLAVLNCEIDPLLLSKVSVLLVGFNSQIDTGDFLLLFELRIAEIPVQGVESVVVFARHISHPKIHDVTSKNKKFVYIIISYFPKNRKFIVTTKNSLTLKAKLFLTIFSILLVHLMLF